MKRTIWLAICTAFLAVAAPLAAAQAADLDPPARGSVHHGHNYTDRCQSRLDRCTKWFASSGDRCQKRYERCEELFTRWHDRRVAHYQMRQGHSGHHEGHALLGHRDHRAHMGHHEHRAMAHRDMRHSDMSHHGKPDHGKSDHHKSGAMSHRHMAHKAADTTK